MRHLPDRRNHLRNGAFLARLFATTAASWSLHVASATMAGMPADAPPELKKLLGEYGAPGALLTIYEADGRLFADGAGLQRQSLYRLSSTRFAVTGTARDRRASLRFELDGGRPRAVTLALYRAAVRLPYVDIGQLAVDSIRSGRSADASALRADALQATPPSEPAAQRPADLVDLSSLEAPIKFDIRYATSNNFMGFPLYEKAAAYLQRPAAQALRRAALQLEAQGFGLLIYDAYRPWFVTQMFWWATPPDAHVFVADPAQGSRHNRGCAVDLTLYELPTGLPVEMTGDYDEMSPRSYADFVGGTSRERFLREILRLAMEQQGFSVYAEEWWHFDYRDWHEYGIGNATFEHLEASRAEAGKLNHR